MFKITILFLILSFSQFAIGQLDIEKYAGKKYRSFYKAVSKDSTFVGCRVLRARPNKVTGVELFFKNDIHYVVSFTKGKLDDGYTCESKNLRGMTIYVIHYYKEDVYQNGYCKCTDSEKARLIEPLIKKVELEEE